jgi:2-polyprenyl-6-methoxyphenol hydroxylase-like FAD-dependent oxidoreductase
VTGLLPDADGNGVAGVRLRPQNQPNGKGLAEEQLLADLVVDAAGRGSRVPQWLEALGYDRPQETMINAHLGYASRIYRRPPRFQDDWKGIFVQAAPPDSTRGGVCFPIEGDRWMVTLVGGDRDYPPTDEAGFTDFARSLPSPMIHDVIRDAEPLTPIYRYRATENRLRHYEKLSRWPEKLLVMGDAACAFNPVYGQGMTTAALGVETLDRCLSEQRRRRPNGDLAGLARRFQKKLAKVNKAPWTLATGEDYRYRETEGGKQDWATRIMHRYMDRVLRLSTEDAAVRLVLLEAFNLMKLPTALFQPGILARVLCHALTRPRAVEETAIGRKLPEAAHLRRLGIIRKEGV